MPKYLTGLWLISLIFANACQKKMNQTPTEAPAPPMADKQVKLLEIHDDVRQDPYYWLNDRENEEVIDYLERENDYYQKMTAHTEELKDKLFHEIKSRIKEKDESVPYFYNGYYYITRYEEGQDYPIYTRKKDSLQADEEILEAGASREEERSDHELGAGGVLARIHTPEGLGTFEGFFGDRLAVVFTAFDLLDGFFFDVNVGHGLDGI